MVPPRRRRARRLIRLAALAALGAWLLKRRRNAPAPEGTWREVGAADGSVTSGRP